VSLYASSSHAISCGALVTNAATASQSHFFQSSTPVAETSAIAMNASATSEVPESTSTGESSAPMIPIAAISREFQRTAISVATAPTRPGHEQPDGRVDEVVERRRRVVDA
jgi:hypothetical protein